MSSLIRSEIHKASAAERTPPGNQGSELSWICGPAVTPLSGLPCQRRKTLRDFSIEKSRLWRSMFGRYCFNRKNPPLLSLPNK